MERKIKQIQTVIFIRNLNISTDVDKTNWFSKINNALSIIFDSEPSLVPIPNDAPPEIPRFILKNLDSKLHCNISLSRIDFFYDIDESKEESFTDIMENHKSNRSVIFNFLLDSSVLIYRIGFISLDEIKFTEKETAAFNYLKNSFILEGKLNNLNELLIRTNHLSELDHINMNNIITIIGDKDNINIQTDINNVLINNQPELMNNLVISDINKIVDYSIEKTISLIEKFPNI